MVWRAGIAPAVRGAYTYALQPMAVKHPPLLRSKGRQGWIVVTMLVCAFGLYVAGILRPFTAVTKLWIFESEVSVIGGMGALWKENEYFLFLILTLFTVVFPAIKMMALLALWVAPGLTRDSAQRYFRFVSNMGKWSMLDVFVVAILVILMRSGGIAEIAIKDGVVLFTCAVILTQFAAFSTGRAAQSLERD